jgi:hypothetical protein
VSGKVNVNFVLVEQSLVCHGDLLKGPVSASDDEWPHAAFFNGEKKDHSVSLTSLFFGLLFLFFFFFFFNKKKDSMLGQYPRDALAWARSFSSQARYSPGWPKLPAGSLPLSPLVSHGAPGQSAQKKEGRQEMGGLQLYFPSFFFFPSYFFFPFLFFSFFFLYRSRS